MAGIFGTFGLVNWLVLAIFFGFITLVGHLTRGKSKTMRGFFLGGKTIPWWAVAGSIVATQTSALTFIAVPAAVFRTGGNLTFHQMIYGMILGNILMAFVFVRAYYEHEIYSPYDFMGNRLGTGVSQLARGMFLFGGILSQGVRLLSTALILSVVTGLPVAVCVLIIGIFAIIWTLMGGITTVIWTDVVQFGIFTTGALFSVAWLYNLIPGGVPDIIVKADNMAKLVLFDLSTDPKKAYTLWVGLLGFSTLQFAQNAVDQVSAQRIMCCRNAHEAKKAVIFAAAGCSSFILMLTVGLLLSVFYSNHSMPPDTAALMAAEPDRIFPHFIITELPVGISGIIISALFTAGISTLDSALAAFAQTFISGIYQPYIRPAADDRHYLIVSRAAIVFVAVILCGIAVLFYFLPNEGLLNLGLMVPGYVYGPLLGIAFLALMRRGTFKSILAGTILSVGVIITLQKSGINFFWGYPAGSIIMIVTTFIIHAKNEGK